MSVKNYSSKYIVKDIFVVTLAFTMLMTAFFQQVYVSQEYFVITSIIYYFGNFLKIVVVVISLFLLLRLKYPQNVVAGILLFGFWLLPEFFPDSLIGLFIKKVNDIFGYFGGVLIYPVWRWQVMMEIQSSKDKVAG